MVRNHNINVISGSRVASVKPLKPVNSKLTSQAMTGQRKTPISPEEMEWILEEAKKLR